MPFSPTDIAGLTLWLKADAITGLADGEAVTTWLDSSASGFDASQTTTAAKPTYETSVLNGKPVVRFDGTDDNMVVSEIDIVQPGTVFIVASRTSTAERHVLDGVHSSFRWLVGGVSGAYATFAGTVLSGGTLDTSAHRIAATFNGASSLIRVDGVQVASGNAGTGAFGASGGAYIGCGNGLAGFFPGDVAEVIVYAALLSATEIEQVETYLNEKWFGAAPASRNVAKQYLLSAGTGTKRELDPTLAGTASTATAVTYPLGVGSTGIRRFSPETSNGTTATIPAAPATFSGVGWEMDAVINADRIQFVDENWAASFEYAIAGATTGPSVTFTVIYYVNGAEIGRVSLAELLSTGGIKTTLNLTAAALDATIISTVNPKIQIEFYVNVTLAAISVGTTTHSIRTNDADSWIDPGSYAVRAQRTLAGAVSLSAAKGRKLTFKRSRSAALTLTPAIDITTRRIRSFAAALSLAAARRFVIKPKPKAAAISLTATRQPHRITLARAGMKAAMTLTADITRRISLKPKVAALSLNAAFARQLRFQRRFAAALALNARMFVTISQAILARMVSGGTTIIRKFFPQTD